MQMNTNVLLGVPLVRWQCEGMLQVEISDRREYIIL